MEKKKWNYFSFHFSFQNQNHIQWLCKTILFFFAVYRPNNNCPCLWHALSSQEACTSISVIILWKIRWITFCSRLLAFEMTTTTTVNPNGWQEQRQMCFCLFVCKGTHWDCEQHVPLITFTLSPLIKTWLHKFEFLSVFISPQSQLFPYILKVNSEAALFSDQRHRLLRIRTFFLRFLLQPMWAAYQQYNNQLVLYRGISTVCSQGSMFSEMLISVGQMFDVCFPGSVMVNCLQLIAYWRYTPWNLRP